MTESAISLKPGETVDRLGYQGLRIIQDPSKFKFTLDAFLLAGFVSPKPDARVVDLGSGGGVIPLLLAGQDGVGTVCGIEIQEDLAEMARRSAALNGLSNRIRIINGDLRQINQHFSPNTFDDVLTNPPYYPVNQGVIPKKGAVATAKFEIKCKLTDWVKAAAAMVKANGRVVAVYPAQRLAELIDVLQQYRLIPKRLCLVYSKPDSPGNLALIEARPCGKSGLHVLAPFYIYNPNGKYSLEMEEIFRGQKF